MSLSTGGSSGTTLTDLVQSWADGSFDNYGLALVAASETNTSGWKIFNSVDASSNRGP